MFFGLPNEYEEPNLETGDRVKIKGGVYPLCYGEVTGRPNAKNIILDNGRAYFCDNDDEIEIHRLTKLEEKVELKSRPLDIKLINKLGIKFDNFINERNEETGEYNFNIWLLLRLATFGLIGVSIQLLSYWFPIPEILALLPMIVQWLITINIFAPLRWFRRWMLKDLFKFLGSKLKGIFGRLRR